MTGVEYRLLSDDEWEYAARGSSNASRHLYSWGDDDPVCNPEELNSAAFEGCTVAHVFPDEQLTSLFPVGIFRPNDFGLRDMHGNVAEWTEDCRGAVLMTDCLSVVRGGSYVDPASSLRLTSGSPMAPATRLATVGFRVARTIGPPRRVVGVVPRGHRAAPTGRWSFERSPTADEIAAVYPREALEAHQGGTATMVCTVQADHTLVCEVVSETPEGRGFGDAALRLVPTLRLDPDSVGGVGTSVYVPIRFFTQGADE
jgi:hypothetical protein